MVIVHLSFASMYPDAINKIANNEYEIDFLYHETLNLCFALQCRLNVITNVPIIWLGFEDYCYQYSHVFGHTFLMNGLIDSLNVSLVKQINYPDVFIDFKNLIASVGISNFYSIKNAQRWGAPYSQQTVNLICKEIYKQYLINCGTTVKCIVLDCDNVIWGGVLSEIGIENILISPNDMGKSFWEFQNFLLTLYYHGIILAVCSKNDEEDVLRVFREHDGMILKEKHISCFQVNWSNKIENIKKISETLNISLKHIAFIDDSIFEIESVRCVLPEVVSIEYDREKVYEHLGGFINLRDIVDIANVEKRVVTYKTDEKRRELKESSCSFEEYIKSLGTIIDIHISQPVEYARLSELTQRTNKMTNGVRYTVNELYNKVEEGYTLLTVKVSDKFSDLGILGVMGISEQTLDLFSLSCRALGRNIEEELIKYALDFDIKKCRFVSTGKNEGLLDELLGELLIYG